MLGIKKFLQPDNDTQRTLFRVIQVLVEGVAKASFEDEPTHAIVEGSLREISDSFTEDLPPSEFLVRAGALVSTLNGHNQATARYSRRWKLELKTMIRMLCETLRQISSSDNQTSEKLKRIEKQITSVTDLQDLLLIQLKLADWLAEIRKEAEQQRVETQQTLRNLSQSLEEARAVAAENQAPRFDPVTLLPLQESAESALSEHCRTGKGGFVIVMILDRLQTYNVRYGRKLGDDVLRHVADFLKRVCLSTDTLFRWSGPSIVAITNRNTELEDVRAEIRKVLEGVPEFNADLESRTVMLPIATRWAVSP